MLEAAPEVEAPVTAVAEGPAGHGTIRLRTAAPAAAVEAALEASSDVDAEVITRRGPGRAAGQR